MALFSAFLDANVLVPVAPCDTLLRLSDRGAFRPLWSGRVLDEAMNALLRIHPDIDQSRFQSRFRSMNEAFEDALVDGWEPLEESIDLPDPNDRHVVAAAIIGRADVIVTHNTRDFPATVLKPLGIEAVRLDDFLLDQFHINREMTIRVVVEQAQAMTNPPAPAAELLSMLERSGAPNFADRVRNAITE